MKFSIVTISYNQARFLEQAITSVLAQSGVELEYIIVDPGSTDGSREIIERYRDRIAHIIYEKDQGPADGLNRGFARATGDWFGYINSDDYYLDGGLRNAAAAVNLHPDAGAIIGNGFIVDEFGSVLRRSISQRFSLSGALHGSSFALQQATFYRAKAFRSVNGFNIGNRTCWDGEILCDLADKGYNIRRVYDNIGAFRIHSLSITGSGRVIDQYWQDRETIFERIAGRKYGFVDRAIVGPIQRIGARLLDPRRSLDMLMDRSARRRKRLASAGTH